MKAAHYIYVILFWPLILLCQTHTPAQLSADILVTPESCGFDPWQYTLSHDPDLFPNLDTVYPGQQIRVLGFIKNKYSGSNVNMTCKLRFLGPDGREFTEAEGSMHGTADGKPLLIDSLAYGITFKETDPLGDYYIELEIKDADSGQKIFAKHKIHLKQFVVQGTFENEAEYAEWLNQYYHEYDLARASAAYLYLARMKFNGKSFEDSIRLNIQTAFYETLYGRNRWVLPHLQELYPSAYPDTKKKIVFIFSRLDHYPRSLFTQVNQQMLGFSDWAKNLQISDTTDKIHTALQLDIEWAHFFASGKFEYVEKITALLNYADEKNSPANATKDPTDKISRVTVLNAAKWSLASNCQSHPLVKAYCEYIVKYGNLKPEASKLLHAILNGSGND